MKRLVLSLVAAITLAAPARAQTVVVGVGGELSQRPYYELRVPVYVDMTNAGGEKLGSYTIRVSWDPDSLYYRGFEAGPFAVPQANADSVYQGIIWISAVSPAGMDGVFDIVRLVMEVPVNPGTTSIDVAVTEMSAGGTLVDLLATATVTTLSGTFCTAVGVWGDLDDDGLANSRDALAILSAVIGLDVPGFTLALGDVDGDGAANTRDALILLSYTVGIDIAGQRVLLIAPGACAAGDVPTLAIEPDTADLVVGQFVQLVAMAEDASGVPTAISGVNWLVDHPDVATVDADGLLTGRGAGTTTIRAGIGPGVEITGTVIVRDRRAVWYVDAATASQRPVQLGTMAYPYASPQYAFPHLREGDTVRVLPGIHDYEYYYGGVDAPEAGAPLGAEAVTGPLNVGAVFIGDTLADGTRPVLRAPEDEYLIAFPWYGGLWGEIHNLEFQGFAEVVEGYGVRNLLVSNVRVQEPQTIWGEGLYIYRPVDTLLVLNSEFLADTTHSSSYGIYLSDGADLVVVHDSRFEYWNYAAIYGGDIDSTDVRRSEFTGMDDYAIRLWVGDRPDLAATLVQNRFVDNYYESLYITGARSITMQGNYVDERYYDALDLRGTSQVTGSVLRSTNDSILFSADDWDWIWATQFDSVLIDGLWLNVVGDSSTWMWSSIDANYVSLTNSELLNLVDGDGFIASTRELVVDNTQFIGCPTCTWQDAYAIEAWSYMDSGPRVSITNSTFQNVQYAFWHTIQGDSSGPMVFTGNTVDSALYGFRYKADSSLVQNNTFSRIRDYGVYAEQSWSTDRPPQRAVFQGNDVTCSVSPYTSYGLYTYYIAGTFDDNVVRDCDYGIYAYYSPSTAYPIADLFIRGDSVFMPADSSGQYGIYAYGRFGYGQVSGNTVRRGSYGMYLIPDILAGDTSFFRLDSNAVSQTLTAGIRVYPYDSLDVVGVRNNISNNYASGFYSQGVGVRSLTLGRFVGNLGWAVYLYSGTADATQNWWGSVNGSGGAYGSGSADADSVSSPSVDATPFLTSDPTDVPPLAPPAGIAYDLTGATVPAAVAPPAPGIAEEQEATEAEVRAAHLRRRAEREATLAVEQQAKRELLERMRQERRQARAGGGF